jgi:hypothetical protein
MSTSVMGALARGVTKGVPDDTGSSLGVGEYTSVGREESMSSSSVSAQRSATVLGCVSRVRTSRLASGKPPPLCARRTQPNARDRVEELGFSCRDLGTGRRSYVVAAGAVLVQVWGV